MNLTGHCDVDETFRLRRSNRTVGLLGTPISLAVGSLLVYLILSNSGNPNRFVAAVFLGLFPLVMAGLSLWCLVASYRETLTIRAGRIFHRGVVRATGLDLGDVTAARWRWPGAGLVLRTDAARLTLRFHNYEPGDADRLIHHLRSALRPEVQIDWNLFAYKVVYHERRTKPGPGEILLRRERWDRYFVPWLAGSALAGLAGWWITGQTSNLALPVPTLVILLLARFSTPAEGEIVSVSGSTDPDSSRLVWFLSLWGAAALAGLWALRAQAEVVLGAWGVLMFAVLVIELGLHDRRQKRREREAADLAAKARGEGRADPWGID